MSAYPIGATVAYTDPQTGITSWTVFCYCGGAFGNVAYVWLNNGGTFIAVPVSALS